MRRPGAASLDLAYVAAGRVDGFWEIGLSAWDTAAGTLLITEAGGRIGTLTGQPYTQGGHVVAGTPKVFDELVGLHRPVRPGEPARRLTLSTLPSGLPVLPALPALTSSSPTRCRSLR